MFFWILGFLLAFTGSFIIVGPATLAAIPLNALVTLAMDRRQCNEVGCVCLSIRMNLPGFLAPFFL